jgi:hypothetical protein
MWKRGGTKKMSSASTASDAATSAGPRPARDGSMIATTYSIATSAMVRYSKAASPSAVTAATPAIAETYADALPMPIAP